MPTKTEEPPPPVSVRLDLVFLRWNAEALPGDENFKNPEEAEYDMRKEMMFDRVRQLEAAERNSTSQTMRTLKFASVTVLGHQIDK